MNKSYLQRRPSLRIKYALSDHRREWFHVTFMGRRFGTGTMSKTIKRARKSEKQARQKLINQIVSMHEKWASDDDWLQDLFREWTPILAAMDVAELRDMLEATERANGTIKQYETFGAKFDNRFDQPPIPDAAIKRRGPISAAINCLVDQLDMTHEQVASTNGAEFLR